jgi:hypothetical protein
VRLHSTVSFPSCKSREPRPYLTNSSTVTDPLSSAIFAQLPPIRLIISSISCGQRRAYGRCAVAAALKKPEALSLLMKS